MKEQVGKNIYAIIGMPGAGKSVVTEIMKDLLSIPVIHFGGFTQEIIREKGVEVTPQNEQIVREELRAKYGMGAYAKIALEKVETINTDSGLIIDGLYSLSEYKILHDHFLSKLQLICVISDKKIRYSRLESRSIRPLSREEAQNRDWAEVEKIEKGGPIALADVYIVNNGSFEELLNAVKNKIIYEK